jgi:hypothetical protein
MLSPIFIVGANRSGTTLLRLILNAHSRIAIPEELTYFDSYIAGVPIADWKTPSLSPAAYEAFLTEFLDTKCAPLHDALNLPALQESLQAPPFDLRRPYQEVLEMWARAQGKPRWGEKTPSNAFYVDIIADMFPAAKFIHLVRDPRGGVNSMQKASFFPDDVVFNSLSRMTHTRAARELFARHLSPDQHLTIRYEDLAESPEPTTRRICTFLGEAFEPSMLRYYEDADRFMKQDAATSFNAAATRPVTDAMIHKWTDRLSTEEIAIIEHLSAEDMAQYGYAPTDGPPPSRRVRLQLLIKRLYWSIQRWRNRDIRHYTVKSPILARSRARLRMAWTRYTSSLYPLWKS